MRIATDPPLILYWSNFQRQVFCTLTKRKPACLIADASGTIFKNIVLCDGTDSPHLFLYSAVVNDEEGHFSVSQMISASHSACKISFWLSEWAADCQSFPKEFVSVAGKALLIGAIRAFASYLTIEDYVTACEGPNLPRIYVRIDVAHFIKTYADLIKNVRSRVVRVFYKSAIGLLVKTRNSESAKKILKAILLSARCGCDGNLGPKKPTQCQKERDALIDMLDPREREEEEEEHSEKVDKDDCLLDCDENRSIFEDESLQFTSDWLRTAQEIDNEVKEIAATEITAHISAYEFPELADRLVNDIRFFTIWSCIDRDRFGYGRIPASSAPVESEFKNIKAHLLLEHHRFPMRLDEFLEIHIQKYIALRMHIVGAKQKVITARELYSSTEEDFNDSSDFTASRDVSVDETRESFVIPLTSSQLPIDSFKNFGRDNTSLDIHQTDHFFIQEETHIDFNTLNMTTFSEDIFSDFQNSNIQESSAVTYTVSNFFPRVFTLIFGHFKQKLNRCYFVHLSILNKSKP